jgi:hypothetical protein
VASVNININDEILTQDEIDEHVEIMRSAGESLTGRVMLLSDPEYPTTGAYRVWCERQPILKVGRSVWLWVTPDGEIIASNDPASVTD